jgi:hypothetical protein
MTRAAIRRRCARNLRKIQIHGNVIIIREGSTYCYFSFVIIRLLFPVCGNGYLLADMIVIGGVSYWISISLDLYSAALIALVRSPLNCPHLFPSS